MRSLLCIHFERQAAQLAVTGGEPSTGSSLERHLQRCDSCRRVTSEIARISRALGQIPETPAAESTIEDLAWKRLQSTSIRRPSLARGLTLAAAATCFVTIVFILSNRAPAPTGNPMVSRGAGRSGNHSSSVAKTERKGSQIAKYTDESRTTVGSEQPKKPVQPHRRSTKHRSASGHRIHRSIRPVKLMAKATTVPTHSKASQTKVATTSATTDWASVGSYYEYYGDYRSAAAAYDRALDSSPTPALLYQAGRAEEYSGDIEGAVEHLSQLLMRSKTKSKNTIEKGSLPWKEKPHSA